jgi:nodulation protein E
MTRVVVTGMGCISALGCDLPANWASLRDGRTGITFERVGAEDASLDIACPVAAFGGEQIPAPVNLPDARVFRQLDRSCKFAITSAAEAIADARLPGEVLCNADTAIVFGSSTGGLTSLEASYYRIYAQRAGRVHPMTIPRFMPSGAASAISLSFGISGPAWCVSSACASSSHAIAEATYMIRSGRTRVAITGGAESSITYGHLLAWHALGALATDTCRPFSRARTGMVLGEGGATLVLEELEHARARGAPIHAEILGCGASSDAQHLTQPTADGQARAIRQALRESALPDAQRFLISTHGTGTQLNDVCETTALRAVFGDALQDQVAVATKSAHGHLLGGTGALELVVAIRSLQEKLAPPICNFLGRDEACDLPLVIGEARPITELAVLSNSFAFGGLNSVLVLGPPPDG